MGLLIAAALLILPAPASAGTYDVVSCLEATDNRNQAWRFERYNTAGATPPDGSLFNVNTTCVTPTGIRFDGAVDPKRVAKINDGAGWTFRAPQGTLIRRLTIWRNGQARVSTDNGETTAPENGWWNVVARAGDSPAGRIILNGETCAGNNPDASGYCQIGAPEYPRGAAIHEIGQPVVTVGVECAGPAPNSLCSAGSGTTNFLYNLHAARVTVEDPTPPDVDPGLPEAGFRRPGDAIGASATDIVGISSLRILVDGVERHAERQVCDFREIVPCPLGASKFYDLTGVADGRHVVTTMAEDSASNINRVDRTVEIDGTPPVIDRVPVSGRSISVFVADALSGLQGGTIEVRRNAASPFAALPTTRRGNRLLATVPRGMSPSRIGTRVSATDNAGNTATSLVTSMSLRTRVGSRFRTVRNAQARIPYGRAVAVAGRLTTTDGAPFAHQPIVVSSVLRQVGATSQPLTSTTTDATGRFRFTVAAGPSRELTVAYPGGAGVLRRSRELRLLTRASATIHTGSSVIRGQRRVRFFGRLGLRGAQLPTGGKSVELQAFQRGRWTTVDTARASGPNATWSGHATFSGRPGRFRLRLRIPRDPETFPYETGFSRSIVVRVR